MRLLFAVVCLSLSAMAWAQAGKPAQLMGVVTDPSGARIPNATVHLGSTNSSLAKDVPSDAAGQFSAEVPPGTYNVVITAAGFDPFFREMKLAPGAKVSVAANLVIATPDETVEVTGTQASMGEADNKSSLVIGREQLQTLSDDDATFQQQLQAIAGGDGQHAPEVYVDGFSGGQFPPKSSIRQIRINQNPYSAEYDQFGFGRIEIDTKPGTGQIHGNGESFGNDSVFNSQNPSLHQPEPGYYRLHLRGGLSGPIDKKTSFVLNGEYYNQQNNAIINAQTDSGFVNTAVPNPQVTQDYLARIDRQWSTNNTATARYEFNRIGLTNGGLSQFVLPSEAYNSTTTTQTLQVGNSQVITPHLEHDTRFQWQRTSIVQDPVSNAPTILVSGTFSGGGSAQQLFHDTQDQFQFEEKGTYEHGKHLLRAGFRFRLNREVNRATSGFNGTYYFSRLEDYEAGKPSQVSLTTGQSNFSVSTADFAAYFEDEWKVRKNVTLDAGFRAESQTAVPDHWDPSPHVGVAWAFGQTDKKQPWMTLRSGASIFYDRFQVGNLLTTVQRGSTLAQQTYTSKAPGQCDFTQVPDSNCLPRTMDGNQTTYRLAPNFKNSYDFNAGLTAEFPLGKRGGITFNYLFERGVHYYVTINANAPINGLQPFGSAAGNLNEFSSGGRTRGNFLFTNPHVDITPHIHWWAFAILQRYNSDTMGPTTSAFNSYNIHQDYGRSQWDRHQALFTGVNADLKWGFHLGTFLAARGGQPFNITTGGDENRDTFYNDRPSFASALSDSANVIHTSLGDFDTKPVAGEKIVPINYGHSPAFVSLQVQLGRSWKFGPRVADPDAPPPTPSKDGKPTPLPDPRYTLEFSIETQNITNTVSPATRIGVLSSPYFGRSIGTANNFLTTSAANRTLTFHTGFRF